MIQITKRDEEFLRILNKAGACSSKVPKVIYPARYSRNRLEKMEKEKIINRRYNLITLATKGLEYMESIGEKPRSVMTYPIDLQRRLANTLDLSYELPSLKIIPSAEYKRKRKLNRGLQFLAAALTEDGYDYLIYDVSTNAKSKNTRQITKELFNIRNQVTGIIILSQKKTFVQYLIKKNVPISELIILPRKEYFMELLNELGQRDFDAKILGKAFPTIAGHEVFKEKRVQYMIGNNVYMNMILNNVSIFSYLQGLNQVISSSNSSSAQIYNIVCLDIQEEYIKRELESREITNLTIKTKPLSKKEILNS